MKIGIIGAGHIGSALATRLVAAGHDVHVSNSRGPETLRDVATLTGAIAATREEAVREADVVVVTIPLRAVPDLPEGLVSSLPATVPVIDTCNYYPQNRDGRIDGIEEGLTESAWVARTLGHTVVKAFNNVYSRHIVEPPAPGGGTGRMAVPIAGDDAEAKERVAALIEEIGFDVVDAGSLADSWKQEPGSPVYGAVLDAAGVRAALDSATSGRTADWRA
jgi:predicted dinucleotide-binding enzyme